MRNVLDKSYWESQNTFYVQWRFSKNRAVYETNMEEYGYSHRGHRWQYSACALHGG